MGWFSCKGGFCLWDFHNILGEDYCQSLGTAKCCTNTWCISYVFRRNIWSNILLLKTTQFNPENLFFIPSSSQPATLPPQPVLIWLHVCLWGFIIMIIIIFFFLNFIMVNVFISDSSTYSSSCPSPPIKAQVLVTDICMCHGTLSFIIKNRQQKNSCTSTRQGKQIQQQPKVKYNIEWCSQRQYLKKNCSHTEVAFHMYVACCNYGITVTVT